MNGKIRINNVPPTHKRFVVASVVDGEGWYWCSVDDADRAFEIAAKFEAAVPTDGEFVIAYDLYIEGDVLDFLGRGDGC